MKNILTIAGSDSSGGAGIQADIKTFAALGTYGMSVITAVTAQNTQGVFQVAAMSREMVKIQLDAVFSDIRVDAVKIGMVVNAEIIGQIASSLVQWGASNIVLDTVMISTSGHTLLEPKAIEVLKSELFPLATMITPNIPEAQVLVGKEITEQAGMEMAAQELYRLGAKSVLVKGGHLPGDAIDVLFDGQNLVTYSSPRINQKNTHGTGCTLSSAIAVHLALGYNLPDAVGHSKAFVTGAIKNGLDIGHGIGPVDQFFGYTRKC